MLFYFYLLVFLNVAIAWVFSFLIILFIFITVYNFILKRENKQENKSHKKTLSSRITISIILTAFVLSSAIAAKISVDQYTKEISDKSYIQLKAMKDFASSNQNFDQYYQAATAQIPVTNYRFEKLQWQFDYMLKQQKKLIEKDQANKIKENL
ncbi:hypothetical protein MUB04_15705 [Acinetobacter indicus]|uniref:OadG family protein n=1 Tax=Acinetobacter TaxID=469 RepID=UPI0015D1C04B|nr:MULTISPECIES: OadG family protein [Acinetobacter]MCP0917983.1 hypothetical protein [Acinetobacter indicus]